MTEERGDVSLEADIEEASYPSKRGAVKNSFFSARAGGLTLIAGPSGSGKTTLLLTITGVLKHLLQGSVKGKVNLAGVDPLTEEGFNEVPRIVGAVMQDPDKQLAMPTPYDEVSFTLENLGISDEERVWSVLRKYGLEEHAFKPVEHLSGGQQRRLAIAAALAHDPNVVVLDEPTASLDPWGIKSLRESLTQLLKEGKTVIVVEHKVRYFLDMTSRTYVIKDGTIIAEYGRDELLLANAPKKLLMMGIDALPPEAHIRDVSGKDREGKAIVSLDGVACGYGDTAVLEDISMELRAGEVSVLVGPNGSGKTTLLKCIAGLLEPLDGHVRVMGEDPRRTSIRPRGRLVFYVPQIPDYTFVSNSVESELKEVSKKAGVAFRDLVDIAPWIKEALHRPPYRLSHGQRRWLALSVGIAYAPKALLLDEPTTGLDLRFMGELRRLLAKAIEAGAAVLIATHDPRLVAEVADRAFIVDGRRVREVSVIDALKYLEEPLRES